jgi:hypothetical protein
MTENKICTLIAPTVTVLYINGTNGLNTSVQYPGSIIILCDGLHVLEELFLIESTLYLGTLHAGLVPSNSKSIRIAIAGSNDAVPGGGLDTFGLGKNNAHNILI